MNQSVPAPSRVILASASPQRTHLLTQLGVAHTAIAADIDERQRPGESAEALAERLARTKAEALSIAYPNAVIIGSDTVVASEDAVFGKPVDAAQAATMLGVLAGATHRVISGVAILVDGITTARVASSAVTMRALEASEIEAYIASGEPFGKAGAYAIQGLGALFVERLEGSYSAVMGLPLFETGALLRGVGIDPLAA
ncbi:Maf family protein [Salinisphaera aquimarina]|uniref:Nucleoside triphosphate pyrophosphatase n=1 Tax=Salinisphaera aquimarina TaxID=2094031 RepID=A0ABV7ENG7_9GAMM